MRLLVDVGNSRLKWARATGDALAPDAAEHDGRPAQRLADCGLPRADEIWVASVMGADTDAALHEALERACGVAPRFARTQAERDGLRVAYADASRLGVDRWLAMLALWTASRGPFCVVSAGTALTFDAVDERGRHLGGLIAPGLATSEKAVLGATRFAVRGGATNYTDGLGNDTESCVRQGALHACVGLVERAARDRAGRRYLCGGDAPALRTFLGPTWELRPNLVLEGLLAYAGA